MSSNPELIDLAEKRRIEKIIDKRARIGEMEDAKEEARKTGLAEGRLEGRLEGQAQATLAAVQKVLVKKLKLSPESVSSQLSALTVQKLEALFEAALDFESVTDLENWLKQNG